MFDTLPRSNALSLALTAPANGSTFTTPVITGTEPGTSSSDDGVVTMSILGGAGPSRLAVIPVSAGNPGEQFSVRLIGWRQYGMDSASFVWLPVPLVELLCTVGSVGGAYEKVTVNPPQRLFSEAQRTCSSIAIAQDENGINRGSLGATGELTAWGGDLLAWVLVETRGCQKVQFSFASSDNAFMNMNALYAKT